MMLVRGMHLSVILGSCSLVACQCAVRSAGSLYGGVRRVGLALRYPHFLSLGGPTPAAGASLGAWPACLPRRQRHRMATRNSVALSLLTLASCELVVQRPNLIYILIDDTDVLLGSAWLGALRVLETGVGARQIVGRMRLPRGTVDTDTGSSSNRSRRRTDSAAPPSDKSRAGAARPAEGV